MQLSFPLAAGALICALPLAADIYFQPAEDATLTRKTTLDLTIDLDDLMATAMGQEVPTEEMFASGDTSGEVEVEFDVTDTFVAAERGRALELVREFGQLLVDGEEPEGADEGPGKVRFKWNSESGQYDIELLDEDPSEEALRSAEMLAPDMDFQLLLPEGEVEEGASWTVELNTDQVLGLFAPGFELEGMWGIAAAAAAEEEPQAEEVVREVGKLVGQIFDGVEVTVTYVGVETVDERELAKLNFEFEGDGTFDPSDLIMRAVAMQDEAPEMDVSLSVELTIEAEGTLLWDPVGHHAHDMNLRGTFEVMVDGSAEITVPEMGTIPVEGEGSWSGTFEAVHEIRES